MKATVVDTDGSVRCPKCGAVNSFTSKRTGKAKLFGVVTVGVGAVAMPKRLKCNGCGTNLKRGGTNLKRGEPPRQAPTRRGRGEWRCEKNGHFLDQKRESCPIDGSAVVYQSR
jgi:hypothetical protein